MAGTIIIELNDKECRALHMWSTKRGMTQQGIMRQALKVYDLNSRAIEDGMEPVFRNKDTKEVFENWPLGEVPGCPSFEDE